MTLNGNFIRLEQLTLNHLGDLSEGFDPSLFDHFPKPYATAREFVEENLVMAEQSNYFPFVIIHQATGKAIGCTEFSAIDGKNRKLEIGGSWLRPSFHGTAANSESKFLVLQYAFEKLNFVRVQLTANALNARSRAGIEKIGGKFEGILRNAMILPDGTLRDDACYSIISSEWPSVSQALQRRIKMKLGKTTFDLRLPQLRPVEFSDISILHSWLNSAEALGEYDEAHSPKIESLHKKFDGGGYKTTWIIEFERKRIGYANFAIHPWDDWIACIGVVIAEPEFRGRGIGTSVHSILAEKIFKTFPAIEKLEAFTDVENRAEVRALEKAFFRLEGTQKKKNQLRGKFRDMHVYARLREASDS